MHKLLIAAAATSVTLFGAPASATVLIAGQTGATFTPFDVSTRGTLLASRTESGTAATITGRVAEAVYRNTLGGLDFYYQIFRTGGTREIDGFNTGDFDGFTIDGFTDATDIDGAGGFFSTPNNGALSNGTPSGSTTTFDRSNDGNVVRSNFGLNGLSDSENSTIYILRTSATNFALTSNLTVNNSTSFNVLAYQPVAAVPELGAWAMMIAGVGAVGFALRRRARVRTNYRFA